MAEVGTKAIVHHVKWRSVSALYLSANASAPSWRTRLSGRLELRGFDHVGPADHFI
jgi:hypothetical protein